MLGGEVICGVLVGGQAASSVDVLVTGSISMSICNSFGFVWGTGILVTYGVVGEDVGVGHSGCPVFSSLPLVSFFLLVLCIPGCWESGHDCSILYP